jgi:hypothetical protein
MKVQYRFVNAINAVSATVRPDQLAQLRAAPEVAGVYPVRKLYPAATVAKHLAALGASARPLTLYGADGAGVRVALLDGPVDSGHSYLHLSSPGWNAVDGKPGREARPAAAAHGTAMAGIVAGSGGRRPARRRAGGTLLPIQILEMQHGDLMGTTATLLAGLDRALDPNGDGNLSDHANVILAPVAEPFAGFGASAETVASENVERLGAVLVAAAGNDGPTDARFGTIASPAASPGWLAVGATDGRPKLPRANLTLRADGAENTLDNVPLVSALKPRTASRSPSCCPPVRRSRHRTRSGRYRVGGLRRRLPRARQHESRQRQGRAAAARRRADRAARGGCDGGGRERARALRRRGRTGRRARSRRRHHAADHRDLGRARRGGSRHAHHRRPRDDVVHRRGCGCQPPSARLRRSRPRA